MAQYDGVYSCGHEGRVNIIGPMKNREWKRERIFSGLCPECRKKAQEEEREKKDCEAAMLSKEMELPILSGTEKQVKWANTLRIEAINKMNMYAEQIGSGKKRCTDYEGNRFTVSTDMILECIQFACTEHTDAKFWIEHRTLYGSELALKLLKELSEKEKSEMPEDVKEEMKGEEERLTVKPEGQYKSGVASIECKENTIVAKYVKDDEFIKIVKEKKYRWVGVWQREIDEKNGPIEDRAAELGNALLSKRFAVRFPDEKTKDMAVSGEFMQEQTRWISWSEYAGKLAITWKERNDTLYEAARKLPGAKWDDGCMKVSVEFYREVQDFATTMGFSFSKEVQRRIEKQMQKEKEYEEREVKTVVREKISDEERLRKSLLTSGAIIEDLVDDAE